MSMREAGGALAGGMVIWIVVVCVLLVTGGVFVVVGRPFANYQAETQRQVYQNSLAYQEGAQNDIATFCYQMRTQPDHKAALAGMIREKARVYHGPVTAETQQCFADAGAQ